MPKRKHPDQPTYKEKLFAQEYVANGGNGREAYRRAFPDNKESSSINAVELLSRPPVQAEINALKWAKGLDSTRILFLANETFEIAKQRQNISGMGQILRLIADIQGVITQKSEIAQKTLVSQPDLSRLTLDELQAELLGRLKATSRGVDIVEVTQDSDKQA